MCVKNEINQNIKYECILIFGLPYRIIKTEQVFVNESRCKQMKENYIHTKEDYIRMINELIDKCNDIPLLDLIVKLLRKSI